MAGFFALLNKVFSQRRILNFIAVAIPLLWLTLFFLLPFFVILKISFADAIVASPPYSDLLSFKDERLILTLNLGNYQFIVEDSYYITSYFHSIIIAFFSTLITLLLAYPMAYYIARQRRKVRTNLILLIILPFWTSFLLRVYAWIGILKDKGLFNNILLTLGVIDTPLQILQTDVAVYIGIVYTYLPFLILPIYANLVKLDNNLLESSSDLGANPIVTFINITLPLSMPGVIAGTMLVFIPVIGEFVIPTLLGGSDTQMIGKVLWDEFFRNRNWPLAASVACMIVVIVVSVIAFFQNSVEKN